MSDDFDLDWMRDDDDDESGASDNDDDLSLDWKQDSDEDGPRKDDSQRLGVTGQLSWIQDSDDDDSPRLEDDFPDVDWDVTDEDGAPRDEGRTGVTGELNWIEGVHDRFEDQLDAAEAAARSQRQDGSPLYDLPLDEDEPAQDDGELPPWMSDLGDEADEPADVDDEIEDDGALPAWMQQDTVDDDFDDGLEADADELPPWMTEDDEAVAEPIASAEDSSELPDWMQEDAVEDDEEDFVEGTGELPEWMSASDNDFADDEPVAAPSVSGDLPDWLSGVEVEDDEPVVSEFADEADGDLPDWLTGGGDEEEVIPASEPVEDPVINFDNTGELQQIDDSFFDETSSEEEPVSDDFDLLETAGSDISTGELLGELLGEEDDADDLLASLAADVDTGELLGGDDFDLLGELTADDDLLDDAGSDITTGELLGELLSEDSSQDSIEDASVAAATADEEADFDLADLSDMDEEDELIVEAADDDLLADLGMPDLPADEEAAAISDDDLDALFGDDDALLELESADGLDADSGFDWFEEGGAGSDGELVVKDADDLSWLEQLEDADLDIPRIDPGVDDDLQIEEPEEVDFEAFLSTFEGDSSLALPDTGELRLGTDVDFDELFEDDALEDIEESKPKRPEPTEFASDSPEWLREVQEQSGSSTAAALISRQQDRPIEELPDRLKSLRERGFDLPEPAVRGHTGELSSALPGIIGTLPPATFDPSEDTVKLTEGIILTDIQRERAQLLQSIAGRSINLDDDTHTLEDTEETRRRRRVVLLSKQAGERIAITIALILAMILPFVVDDINIGDLPPLEFAGDTRQDAFFDTVDAVNPGDLVLVAVEYGPTGAAELDTSTEALLLHILLRGGRPVIVGGNAIGLLHVDNLMRQIAEENELIVNRDYIVGQYLVGDTVGLRAFNEDLQRVVRTDIRGEETGLVMNSLDEAELIVVLVERADRLQAWAEQVAPTTSTPLLAVTGASAAPLSLPYIEANSDVSGILIGYEDGYTYSRQVDALLGIFIPTDTPTPTITPTPTLTPTLTLTPTITDTPIGGIPPTDTPTNTPTVTPTSTPTNTPTITPSPTPTATDTPTNTPTPTSTPEPTIFAVVLPGNRVNVRSGPSTGDPVVTSLSPGERVLVIGENEEGDWLNILIEGGEEAWVASFLMEILVVPWDATPVPTEQAYVPPPKARAFAKRQETEEPTPEATAESVSTEDVAATAEVNSTEEAAVTPDATPEAVSTEDVTAEVIVTPEVDSTPEVTAFAARVINPPNRDEEDQRDARWYSMTAGLVVAAAVIAIGNILNILRALVRSRRGRG